MGIEIQAMKAEQLSSALRFCRQNGWNQTRRDWERLLAFQPDGCFAAFSKSELVGTVTSTCYGRQLTWIGMMLVSEQHRRLGIGRALMERCIEHWQAREVSCIALDATPAGAKLYERLGFQPLGAFQRWARERNASLGLGSNRRVHTDEHRACGADIDASLLRLDAEAFGVDRHRYLRSLAADSKVFVSPNGYAMLRPGEIADYLGPIVTIEEEELANLVHHAVRQSSTTLFWDIPPENSPAVRVAQEFGFCPQRELLRMWSGSPPPPGNGHLHALADPATG